MIWAWQSTPCYVTCSSSGCPFLPACPFLPPALPALPPTNCAGAYGDRSPNDTAFPWRNASFILDATVSLPTALVPLLTNASLEQALAAPEEFLRQACCCGCPAQQPTTAVEWRSYCCSGALASPAGLSTAAHWLVCLHHSTRSAGPVLRVPTNCTAQLLCSILYRHLDNPHRLYANYQASRLGQLPVSR